MRDLMESDTLISDEAHEKLSRQFKRVGLDYDAMRKRERKRWRAIKVMDLLIPPQDVEEVRTLMGAEGRWGWG